MDPDPSSSLLFIIAAAESAPLALGAVGIVVALVVFFLLLLVSAFVSGSEVALFSLDTGDREVLADQKDRASQQILYLLDHPRHLLVTILFVNNFVNVGAAVIATVLTAQAAAAFGWTEALLFFLQAVLLTYLLLVLSEITPKLIASRHPLAYSRFAVGPLMVVYRLLSPISSILSGWMSGLQRRLRPTSPDLISTEDLKTLADVGAQHGTLEKQERELIYSIVEFGDTSVREIMISRLDMVALPVEATLTEAFECIRSSGHSRLPLYDEHLDNILGVIYAKDLMAFLPGDHEAEEARMVDWEEIARPAMFVPQNKKLDGLLREFQGRKTHIAIVVDEYGGTAGLVTLEDVLEEIVGEIRDEYDEQENELIEKIEDDTWRVDARIDLDDLNKYLHLELDTEQFDFETLGGLIYNLAGAIPNEGDAFTYDVLHLTVESLEAHRIGFVRVRTLAPHPVSQPERED